MVSCRSTARTSALERRLLGALALFVVVALLVISPEVGTASERGSTDARQGASDALPQAEGASVEPQPPAEAGPPPMQGEAAPPATGDPRVHVVTPGQTPGEIAAVHGVPTSVLTRANGHVEATTLQPGDTLVVPDPDLPRPLRPEDAAAERPRLAGLLVQTAEAYGWNPATVQAVAWVESRWDQHVVSNRGAIGVMQVQPATGAVVSRRIGRELDLHDMEDNIEAGVAYLDLLHERYGSDTRALLAAYHQGPRAVRERGIYRVSHSYADKILRLRDNVFDAG